MPLSSLAPGKKEGAAAMAGGAVHLAAGVCGRREGSKEATPAGGGFGANRVTHRQLHADFGPVQEEHAALQHQLTAAGGGDVDGGSGAVHDPAGVRRGGETPGDGGGGSS